MKKKPKEKYPGALLAPVFVCVGLGACFIFGIWPMMLLAQYLGVPEWTIPGVLLTAGAGAYLFRKRGGKAEGPLRQELAIYIRAAFEYAGYGFIALLMLAAWFIVPCSFLAKAIGGTWWMHAIAWPCVFCGLMWAHGRLARSKNEPDPPAFEPVPEEESTPRHAPFTVIEGGRSRREK